MPAPFTPCGSLERGQASTISASGAQDKDAVSQQLVQLEQRVVKQFQDGLGRIERLMMEQHSSHQDLKDTLMSHPLLESGLEERNGSRKSVSAVKGFPIRVTIERASDIRSPDAAGGPEACCSCDSMNLSGLVTESFTTTSIIHSESSKSSCVWNHSQILESFGSANSLQFCVYDKEASGSELLGKVILSANHIMPHGVEGHLSLTDEKDLPKTNRDGKQASLKVRVEIVDEDGAALYKPRSMKTDKKRGDDKNQDSPSRTQVVAVVEEPLKDNSPQGRLRSVILGKRFESISVLIIILNGIFIGWQSDYAIQHLDEGPTEAMNVLETMFFVWFWTELITKFLVGPTFFFKGADRHWNYFDIFLMSSGTIQLLTGAGGVGASVLRCLRAGRLIRLAPFIKYNPFFKELRLMLYGTFACFRGLLFASIMLVSIMYLFGMVFMGAANGYMRDAAPGDNTARMLGVWYGSLPITIRTLFRVISGGADWFDASKDLWTVHVMYGMLFMAYVFLMVFGVLNVLVGVFVDSAMATASMDKSILEAEAENERLELLRQATEVLESVDKDGSGTVTWEEFEANLTDERVLGFLEAMMIEPDEAQDVFSMVDADDSGFVNINEFMQGCSRLKTGANLDTIVRLIYEMKTMNQKEENRLADLHETAGRQQRLVQEVHELVATVHARLCPRG